MLHSYTDQAIILRGTKLGEADKILTLLTAQNGQVRAVAKGVRRTSSKFGARLSVGNCVKVQLHRGRNLDTVTQAETIGLYAPVIAAEYGSFLSTQVMLETAEKLSDEASSPAEFTLLHGALVAMAEGRYPPGLILAAYLLRALTLAGWSPQLSYCAACAKPGTVQGFSYSLGGVVCAECVLGAGRSVCPSTIQLLVALLRADWATAATSSPSDRAEAEEIATTWAQWVLERKLKSLGIMDHGI